MWAVFPLNVCMCGQTFIVVHPSFFLTKNDKKLVPFQTNFRTLYAGTSARNPPLLFPKVSFGMAQATRNCTLWVSPLVLPHVVPTQVILWRLMCWELGESQCREQKAQPEEDEPAYRNDGGLAHDSGSWDDTFFSKSVACNIESGRWSVSIDTVWYLFFFCHLSTC